MTVENNFEMYIVCLSPESSVQSWSSLSPVSVQYRLGLVSVSVQSQSWSSLGAVFVPSGSVLSPVSVQSLSRLQIFDELNVDLMFVTMIVKSLTKVKSTVTRFFPKCPQVLNLKPGLVL